MIIYLVLIGTMMFSISWQIMRGSTAARATTYEPESARIAVIDRDDDAEHVAQSLRSYLALDGEMVTIDDDSISLQQAVASNYVDLIAIVPQGFAERYLQYADNATATQPTIDTVVSYASGAGSLAQLKVNEFLSLTRTAYLGMPQAQRTLDAAMVTTLDAATADMKQSHIAVVSSDSEDDGTTPGSSAFAGTLKTGLYPLLLVMPVCTFLVVSTFNDNEIRRRLYSSPARLVSNKTMTIATDLGILTPPVHQALSGCDLVALESNYDHHMLRSGRYPYYLRSRIESNRGHLSNDECSAKLLELIQEGCKKFALCHLSQENNTPALALQTMFNTLGAAGVVPEKDCIVQAQRRNEISPALTF